MMALSSEEVPVPVPPPLKSVLDDDCFWIVHREKLVQLPAQPTVETLLRNYFTSCLESSPEDSNCPCPPNFHLLAEVLDGIKVYFDFTLADHLLYGREKEQHRQLGILNPVFSKKPSSQQQASVPADSERQLQGRLPSQVYGATHLLRLFVRLPQFLLAAQIPSNHLHLLHNHFKDLLGYLNSRRHELFLEENYFETVPSLATTNCVSEDTPTSAH